MKKLIEIFRIVFISTEFWALLILILFFLFYDKPFNDIGILLLSKKYIFETTSLFFFAYLGFTITYCWKILKPKENNRILYEWEDYWRLKYRALISIIIVFLSVLLFFVVWFFKDRLSTKAVGISYSISVFIPLVTNFCLLLAAFRINEMLDLTE